MFSAYRPPYEITRFGGWSFGTHGANNLSATVWFNSKAWHVLPAFYNGLTNMILRANVEQSQQHLYGNNVIASFRIELCRPI